MSTVSSDSVHADYMDEKEKSEAEALSDWDGVQASQVWTQFICTRTLPVQLSLVSVYLAHETNNKQCCRGMFA